MKKTLGLTFLGFFIVPYTFSKMEYCVQYFEPQDDIIKVRSICDSPFLTQCNKRYMFLYDKTTGYSIGSYNYKYNDKLKQCFNFFKWAKAADPCDLSFFLIQEKANLDIPEISRKYIDLEGVKIEREGSGKFVLKDFSDYYMDHSLLKELKPQLIQFCTQCKEFNAQSQELNAQLQDINAPGQEGFIEYYSQWEAFETQIKESVNQKGELLNQAIGKQIQWKELSPYSIQKQLINILEIAFNKSLISDAYMTQGCAYLWNTYEPLWTNKVSSLPQETFSDAIKIKDSFSPQPGILIENKEDKVFIKTIDKSIDFQQALRRYYDLDKEVRNNTIAQSIYTVYTIGTGKAIYDLGKIAYNLSPKGRDNGQLELLSKSRILKVYAVMQGNHGHHSLVWGLAEDNETKEIFYWFTDLKTDISTLVNQYKNNSVKSNKIREEPEQEQKKRKQDILSDFDEIKKDDNLKRLKTSK